LESILGLLISLKIRATLACGGGGGWPPNDMTAQKVWYSVYNTPFTGGTVKYTVERGGEQLTKRVKEGGRLKEARQMGGLVAVTEQFWGSGYWPTSP
jgi:hypothetical protein